MSSLPTTQLPSLLLPTRVDVVVDGAEVESFTVEAAHFSVMPSLLFPRPAVVAEAECELLSLKLRDGGQHGKEQQQQQQQRDKLDHGNEEDDRRNELAELAASYVPPFSSSFERSASLPTALSSFSSFSSLSCLSLVSSLFDRPSSFWSSLPRSRSSLALSASLPSSPPPPPPPSARLDESDDSSASDQYDCDLQWDDSVERLSGRAVDEVELLEYSKPSTRDTPSPQLASRLPAAEPLTSRTDATDTISGSGGSNTPRTDTANNSNSSSSSSSSSSSGGGGGSSSSGESEWLRAWQSELSCHVRQREADRRKKRRPLRTAFLIDDDECCHAQLNGSQLAFTTRYRHMTLALRVTQQPHSASTAAHEKVSQLSISADIHLPQLAAAFASFQAQYHRPAQSAKATFPFGLTQSASFSSVQEAGRLQPQWSLTLPSRDPLARSSSLVQFVQSRRGAATHTPAAPPMLLFLRSHVWPLMLDYMQPPTLEQSVPRQLAHSDAADDETRSRQQREATETRLAERERRWEAEIRSMEERERRQVRKQNRAADADGRRGRRREREETQGRQARPRKRTMEE